jgi:hypothetical protein
MSKSERSIHQKETHLFIEFTFVIEQDGECFIGYCPEIPGANGQGRTVNQCRSKLIAGNCSHP